MADIELELDQPQLSALGKLLLGAGYADGEFHDLERQAIQDILSEVIHDIGLAGEVIAGLRDFDENDFQIAEAVDALGELDDAETEAVMAMVAQVTDADFTHDFAESDYLRELADQLGADPEDYTRHVVQVIEE